MIAALGHLHVGNLKILRHHEGRRPHDGRGEHSAGGGHRFYGPGHIVPVAGLFHQRDRKGACGHHVCRRGTGDHSHQGAGSHRRLGWAAPEPPGDRIGHVYKPLTRPEGLQKRPENYKTDNVCGRDSRGNSKDSLGGHIEEVDHAAPGLAAVRQKRRQIGACHGIDVNATLVMTNGRPVVL